MNPEKSHYGKEYVVLQKDNENFIDGSRKQQERLTRNWKKKKNHAKFREVS